jgi:hypothetical protein
MQAINLQMSQRANEMKMRFLELEHKMKHKEKYLVL